MNKVKNGKKKSQEKIQTDFIVFADGASQGNPGRGGWGCIVFDLATHHVTELGGGAEVATNNQMEMTAVGKSLRFIEGRSGTLTIYSDSKYVIDGITKWIYGWKNKGWKKSDGDSILNLEYWKRLLQLVEERDQKIQWIHVPGHSGVILNERCDEIATAFASRKSIDLYSGPLEKYAYSLEECISKL